MKLVTKFFFILWMLVLIALLIYSIILIALILTAIWGAIVLVITIVCLIVTIFAYRALDRATSHEQLTGWGIAAVIFCGVIPGVLMLCMRDQDLAR